MRYVETQTQFLNKDEALVRKAADLLPLPTQQSLETFAVKWAGGHANPDTIDQMKIKHPLRKNAITPLTGAELQDECKGIGRKDLETRLQ